MEKDKGKSVFLRQKTSKQNLLRLKKWKFFVNFALKEKELSPIFPHFSSKVSGKLNQKVAFFTSKNDFLRQF